MSQELTDGISVSGVTRRFGDTLAITDATFTIPAGTVTALIGANGSGKTTLLKILAGLSGLESGTIRIGDLDPIANRREARLQVGWMPDIFDVSQDMTVRGLLQFFASAYQMSRVDAATRIGEVLDVTRLDDLDQVPVRNLSRGQSQRLGLARALLHAPWYLLMDEPDAGLDPASRADLREILRQFAAAGGTALLSTHDVDEMYNFADGCLVMRDGVCGPWTPVTSTPESAAWRISALDRDALTTALTDQGVRWSESGRDIMLPVMTPQEAADLLRAVMATGVAVVRFGPVHGDPYSQVGATAARIAS